MQGEGRLAVGVGEGPLRDEGLGPSEPFLGRLEGKTDRSTEAVPQAGEDMGDAEENGRVPVVPAGVHQPIPEGPVGDFVFLLNRQAVHVRPKEQRGASGRNAADGPQHACPGDPVPVLDPELGESGAHARRGLVLLKAELRVGVELPPQGHDTAGDLVHEVPDLLRELPHAAPP